MALDDDEKYRFYAKRDEGFVVCWMESWAVGNEAGETPHKSQSQSLGHVFTLRNH